MALPGLFIIALLVRYIIVHFILFWITQLSLKLMDGCPLPLSIEALPSEAILQKSMWWESGFQKGFNKVA